MYLALSTTAQNIRFFIDFHGILLVFGGTLAAACISFKITDVVLLLKVFLIRVLGGNRIDYQTIISQIIDLNKKISTGTTSLNELIPGLTHPFLKEAVSLVAVGILTENEIRSALEQRLKTIETIYMREANMFRTIGRFPPCFWPTRHHSRNDYAASKNWATR